MNRREEKQIEAAEELENKIANVPNFIKLFFKSKPKVKSKLTYLSYWNVFNNFFNYIITEKVINVISLNDIKKEDIQLIKTNDVNRYLIYCRDILKNSPDTRKTKYNNLCSLFSYFIGEEIVSKNIMEKVEIEIPKHKPIKYATIQDRDELIKNLGNMKNEFDRLRNIAIVYLLMGSGVRLSELSGLDMDDLHLDDLIPWIYVHRKGGEDNNVKISNTAKVALEEYLIIRPERVGKGNENFLFISEKQATIKDKNGQIIRLGYKGRMSEKTIEDFVKKYSNGKLNPHMFRKGLARIIVNSENGGYSEAAQQLGHGSEQTARRWYAKHADDKMAELLNSF